MKALIAGLVQNPALLKGLLEDPQGLARLAGVGEAELKSLKAFGNVVSGMLNRMGGPHHRTSATPPARSRSAPGNQRIEANRTAGGHGVAMVGAVSLVAVAGALTAAATVSLAAIAGDRRDRRA